MFFSVTCPVILPSVFGSTLQIQVLMDTINNEENDLDAEFRKTLCIIKQYIPYITNKQHIYCYRIWLEKLSQVDNSQKQERNIYLNELSRQIQSGALEAPFTVTPPQGTLPPLQQFQWQCKVTFNKF